MSRKVRGGGLTLTALALLAAVPACTVGETAGADAPPIPVAAVTIGATDDRGGGAGSVSDSFAATIHRDREANLSFRVAGTVRAMPARPGMRLPAGALVAAIDETPYAANATRQSAEVDRLARAAGRYDVLVPEGAIADAQAKDARNALAAARAGLAAARYDLAAARLTMPFSGIILWRQAEIGETVTPGQSVALVADARAPLLAVAQIPAGVAARLRSGLAAQVSVEGLAAPLAGRVLRVAGASDPRSGTVAVDVLLSGAPAGLASGTTASVALAPPRPTERARDGVVLLPAEALLEAQGQRGFVYVIDAGKARRRQVRFLGFVDQAVRVAGLPGGARVITAGAGFVANGQAVTVVAQ
jgi:RND family efflux transporter MFP subunit